MKEELIQYLLDKQAQQLQNATQEMNGYCQIIVSTPKPVPIPPAPACVSPIPCAPWPLEP